MRVIGGGSVGLRASITRGRVYLSRSLDDWKGLDVIKSRLRGANYHLTRSEGIGNKHGFDQERMWHKIIDEELAGASAAIFLHPRDTALDIGIEREVQTARALDIRRAVIFETGSGTSLFIPAIHSDAAQILPVSSMRSRDSYFELVSDQVLDFLSVALHPSLDFTLAEPNSEVLHFVEHAREQIIRAVANHPEILQQIDDREFEEIVAELYRQHGYQVQLTARTRDGGFDVLAMLEGLGTPHIILNECKRYAPDNPVGIALVQRFAGVLQLHDRAHAGAIVTTSRFTGPAVEQAAKSKILYLHDLTSIQNWAQRLGNFPRSD